MNILVRAIDIGRDRGKRRLEVLLLNEAANLFLRETKRQDLSSDNAEQTANIENFLKDLTIFCVDEKKKNLFLLSKDDLESHPTQQEILKQLLDFRFIHQVHENTSASGQTGRYEAYMLDVGLYAHPQRRGNNKVVEVPFWQKDDQYRSDAIRNSPTYRIKSEYRGDIGSPFDAPEVPATEESDAQVGGNPEQHKKTLFDQF